MVLARAVLLSAPAASRNFYKDGNPKSKTVVQMRITKAVLKKAINWFFVKRVQAKSALADNKQSIAA